MESRTYGYARVSTKEQNLDRQMIALQAQGLAHRPRGRDTAISH